MRRDPPQLHGLPLGMSDVSAWAGMISQDQSSTSAEMCPYWHNLFGGHLFLRNLTELLPPTIVSPLHPHLAHIAPLNLTDLISNHLKTLTIASPFPEWVNS